MGALFTRFLSKTVSVVAVSAALMTGTAQADEPFMGLELLLDSVKQSQSLNAKAQCFGITKDQLYSQYSRAAHSCHKPGNNLAQTNIMLAFIDCTEPKLQELLGVSDKDFKRCAS